MIPVSSVNASRAACIEPASTSESSTPKTVTSPSPPALGPSFGAVVFAPGAVVVAVSPAASVTGVPPVSVGAWVAAVSDAPSSPVPHATAMSEQAIGSTASLRQCFPIDSPFAGFFG